MDVAPGRHVLQLLGVAEQCVVVPEAKLDLYVPRRTTTSATFEILCPPVGARVTVTTSGLDFDRDGYRLAVDGDDRATILADSTVLVHLEPGNRTVALTDLASNCAVDGPDSRTVTVTEQEVASVAFAVSCTATSGVLDVVVLGGGAGVVFEGRVDGAMPFRISAHRYVSGVSAGDHRVSLSSTANCTVDTEPQSVTVTTGTLIRDTVEVTFSVTCLTIFLVTAPTTGRVPGSDYSVYLCFGPGSCTRYDMAIRLGSLAPNDTLVAQVRPGTYRLLLEDVPANCFLSITRNPTREITIEAGQLRTARFPVACS